MTGKICWLEHRQTPERGSKDRRERGQANCTCLRFQYRALGTCLMDVPTVLSCRSELRVNAKLHTGTGLAADKIRGHPVGKSALALSSER
jgi:hypothetical protein